MRPLPDASPLPARPPGGAHPPALTPHPWLGGGGCCGTRRVAAAAATTTVAVAVGQTLGGLGPGSWGTRVYQKKSNQIPSIVKHWDLPSKDTGNKHRHRCQKALRKHLARQNELEPSRGSLTDSGNEGGINSGADSNEPKKVALAVLGPFSTQVQNQGRFICEGPFYRHISRLRSPLSLKVVSKIHQGKNQDNPPWEKYK
ncbi:uncharacterized protein LOC144313957 isoform X2 [Canis aureus]